jgi:phosphoglycolate phosphatase-like HAD superfamily hydrolase
VSEYDCLIFDVDGVLIDSSGSYPEMIRRTVEAEWKAAGFTADAPGYSKELNAVFKRHGGFNDDSHIAWVLLNIMASGNTGSGSGRLRDCIPSPAELEGIISSCGVDSAKRWLTANYEERFPLDRVAETCMNIYYGNGAEPGVRVMERPMIRSHWSEFPLPAYVFTGRGASEWEFAKDILSWNDFPNARIVSSDSGILKPSPDGLELICKNFGHKRPIFFGDTTSDMMSFKAFGRGKFVAIGQILRKWDPNFPCVGDAMLNLFGWRDM